MAADLTQNYETAFHALDYKKRFDISRDRDRCDRAAVLAEEGIGTNEISRVTIPAHHDLFFGSLADRATDRTSTAPNNLGIVADILHSARFAIRRENTFNKMVFLCNPQFDHIFGEEGSRSSTPNILAF